MLQLTREARVQAHEALRSRFAQIEIGEQPPDRDRGTCRERRLDLAEPTKKSIRQLPRDMALQQKADVLTKHGFDGCRSHCHIFVRIIE